MTVDEVFQILQQNLPSAAFHTDDAEQFLGQLQSWEAGRIILQLLPYRQLHTTKCVDRVCSYIEALNHFASLVRDVDMLPGVLRDIGFTEEETYFLRTPRLLRAVLASNSPEAIGMALPLMDGLICYVPSVELRNCDYPLEEYFANDATCGLARLSRDVAEAVIESSERNHHVQTLRNAECVFWRRVMTAGAVEVKTFDESTIRLLVISRLLHVGQRTSAIVWPSYSFVARFRYAAMFFARHMEEAAGAPVRAWLDAWEADSVAVDSLFVQLEQTLPELVRGEPRRLATCAACKSTFLHSGCHQLRACHQPGCPVIVCSKCAFPCGHTDDYAASALPRIALRALYEIPVSCPVCNYCISSSVLAAKHLHEQHGDGAAPAANIQSAPVAANSVRTAARGKRRARRRVRY